MFRFLPAPVRGVVAALLLGINTVVTFTLMILPALIKLFVPHQAVRRFSDRCLNGLATGWVSRNSWWMAAVGNTHWDVQGMEGLHRRGWYLVSPNHRSWVDILVLQKVFYGRIPFLKFFLKQQLIWVPVIGLAWWALDFPFMKRGKTRGAQASDMAATRKACEKFKTLPTAVINFVEGTRFSEDKRVQQNSPHRHLLKPKIGALGVALATMGEYFEALLDVTLIYPQGTPTFWDLLCGRVGKVVVLVQRREIPAELVGGDSAQDKALRVKTGRWMQAQWAEKDLLIDATLAEESVGSAHQVMSSV